MMSTSTKLDTLPPEILCQIISHLKFKGDLRSLRLACGTTKSIAEKFLYRVIDLDTHSPIMLEMLLQSQQTAAHVKELQMRDSSKTIDLYDPRVPGRDAWERVADRNGLSLPETKKTLVALPGWPFQVIVSACVNLCRLHYAHADASTFEYLGKVSTATQRQPLLPLLTHIYLPRPRSLKPLSNLLKVAPNISSLGISCIDYEKFSFDISDGEFSTVVDVREYYTGFIRPERRQLFRAFPNLQKFWCTNRDGGAPGVIFDLELHKHQLRHLSLHYSHQKDGWALYEVRNHPHDEDDDGVGERSFASLSGFSELKRLDMTVVSPFYGWLGERDFALYASHDRFFDRLLPRSIEEVRLRYDEEIATLKPHLLRLASRASNNTPLLRKVFLAQYKWTLPYTNLHEHEPQLESLQSLREYMSRHCIDFTYEVFRCKGTGPRDGANGHRLTVRHRDSCKREYILEPEKHDMNECGCVG
jgi:hypothetical protein